MLFSLAFQPLSPTQIRSRLACLVGVTAPLFGAVLYNHGYRISWLACPLRSLTGIPCPFCGITRSLMASVRGQLREAIDYHAFGLLLFVMLGVAALHLLTELGMRRRIQAFYSSWISTRRYWITLMGGFLLYYVTRLLHWAASGDRFWV